MKIFSTTFLTIFCCLLFIQMAQAQIVYGLTKSVSGSMTIPFDITSIDPLTGVITPLFSTNSLIGVAAGASAYDQKNQRYVTWGFDNSNTQKLYVADIDSGTITTQTAISLQPIEMEYDLKQQQAYGLWYTQGIEHFGAIDLNTGAITSIATLPTVSAVAIGNSTFDSNNGRYIFVGIENNATKLISIDVATGAIITSVEINKTAPSIGAFEFDVTSNKLHALYNDIDSSMYDPFWSSYKIDVMFSEVDLLTGNITILDTTPIHSGFLTGYMVGGIAFDQGSQTYIGVLAHDTGFKLKMINATTGLVTSSINLPNGGSLLEIQCDNSTFAKNRYATTTSISNKNQSKISGQIFPNPVSDWLTLDINSPIKTISVYNLVGQKIIQKNNFNQNRLNINKLSIGTYFLIAQTEEGIFKAAFIKK